MKEQNSFKIGERVFVQPLLGLTQLQRMNQNIEKLGFKEFSELLSDAGIEKMFRSDAIYLWLAMLFCEDGDMDFSEGACLARKKIFEMAVIDLEAVGKAIDFFFTSLPELSSKCPVALSFVLRPKPPNGRIPRQKKKRKTGRTSSRKSSSGSRSKTSLGIARSRKKTSR